MEKYSDSFVRNCFENGMLLSAADLTNMQNYFDCKRRMGYHRLVGYGVVFGLTVEACENKLTVHPGLAIDRQGREIYVPSASSISVDRLFLDKPNSEACYLYIEYAEEYCGQAFLISESKLKETVHNRIQETFKLTVSARLEKDKICIANITLENIGDAIYISSVKPFASHFCLAPIWEQFFSHPKSGLIFIRKEDIPDEDGVFRTPEAPHGLGAGKDIIIKLSVKSYDKWRECEIFGDHQLFDVPIQLAAKLFPENGSFVVAAKLQATMRFPVCIRWHAYAAQEDCAYE